MMQFLVPKIRMILIDLDGTLLNNDKKIGNKDFQTLQILGNSGITRVFATGRNLYSATQVLSIDCPFDYLIFSSGAGIMNWKSREIIFQSNLSNSEVKEIEKVLKRMEINFSIQFPIPDNHKYFFHKGKSYVEDFEVRNILYKGFNYVLNSFYPHDFACQFIIILNSENEIYSVKEKITGYKVIRATSPIDGKSVWLEIFSNNVSKALGGKFLCERLKISQNETLGIGNDYNDIEMLDWVTYRYMVSNAPEAIKDNYNECADNQSNPLTDVINKFTQ